MNFKEGEVLYFDKPLRWTSFAVVNKIRYHISRKLGVKKIKVGHAGTLDPLATGVMIICTGKATKRIEEFQYIRKSTLPLSSWEQPLPLSTWKRRLTQLTLPTISPKKWSRRH